MGWVLYPPDVDGGDMKKKDEQGMHQVKNSVSGIFSPDISHFTWMMWMMGTIFIMVIALLGLGRIPRICPEGHGFDGFLESLPV